MNNASFFSAFLSLPALLANLTSATPVVRRQDINGRAASVYQTRFENVAWDNDAWTLTTTNLDQGHYQSRISLANGYIGINLAALGPFFEYDQPVNDDVLNGWPLFDRRQAFATVGGFWAIEPELNGTNFPWLSQYGYDTAITGIPHWAGIAIQVDDSALYASTDASQIQNFSSSIDMRQALMNWQYIWKPSATSLNISYQAFLHKVNVNQAFISLNITAAETTNITLVDVLDGDCATRSMFVDKGTEDGFQYSAVNPENLPDISAYIYTNLTIVGGAQTSQADSGYNATYIGKNESSTATALSITVPAGKTVSVVKFVGIASSDAFDDPRTIAKNAATSAREAGYAAALQSHTEEWITLFPDSSVDSYAFENGTLPDDDNIIEAQIMAVANPFYLLQNTVSETAQNSVGNASINSHSISVGGLGSDSYAGQIFWDAEVWMQPGLVATFPYAALGIANYRVERYEQAQANIETAYQSSKNTTEYSTDGAIFPWTSGRYGNCTATGPCWDYEYHINGDIGIEFVNYWIASGDTEFFETTLLPIFDSISLTFSEILEPNNSQWILTNMTDPDEFANHVDNGGFTMALIAETLLDANSFRSSFNQTPNNTWTNQAGNVAISRNEDANILLEYTGMNGSVSVKQADVVLVTYPLSYAGQNYSIEDSVSDLNYYANKQSQDGPAMTYGVFSIVASEATTSGCSAYTYQQYSTQPYTRAPWFQLSEQLIDDFNTNGGFHPAYPFLTGHGGANQVVLFGYLGFRFTSDWILHIDPNLPPQIPQITYRTFYWHGWPISAFSNQTHTTLTRNSTITSASGAKANSTFSNTPITVHVGPINGDQTPFSLPLDGTITVPNRQTGNIRATPNNLAQCQPAFSDDDVIPGQFPISAVDGALSTKWQPALANETAQLTVQLATGHRLLGFEFDWADAPAYNYSIWLHNDSRFDAPGSFGIATAQSIVTGATVEISSPFDEASMAMIAPIGSNTSTLLLNGTQLFTTGNLQVDAGQEVWTARFATLAIWGSLHNGTLTAANMSGDGATVAEWNIIVEGLDE